MRSIRELGTVTQGENESVIYTVLTTNWGGSPTSLGHDVFDEHDLATSLKATLMPGTPTASVDTITLPALSGLTAGVTYRVTVAFTSGGSSFEAFFRVHGEE